MRFEVRFVRCPRCRLKAELNDLVVSRKRSTKAFRRYIGSLCQLLPNSQVAELDWYNAALRGHPWPLAVGCELVFRFLASHPFQDGNGRIGRALFQLALLQCDDTNLIRDLSESATRVLQCFRELPEQRLTPRLIREETDLPERTISRILRSLAEAGLVQRYGRGAGTRYQLVF